MQKKKPYPSGTTRVESRKTEKKSFQTWISVAADITKTTYYTIKTYIFL